MLFAVPEIGLRAGTWICRCQRFARVRPDLGMYAGGGDVAQPGRRRPAFPISWFRQWGQAYWGEG